MKNRWITAPWRFTILLCIFHTLYTGNAVAQGASDDSFWDKSSVGVDISYASKYIGRRGVDYFGDGPAIHPNITVGLGGTGLYAGVWAAYSIEDGCKDPFGDLCADWDEYDFYGGYGDTLWEGAAYATSFDLSYTYLYYPKYKNQDLHELGLKFTNPNLLPVIGFSRPSLYWGFYYNWHANSVGRDRKEVLLGLGYDLPVYGQKLSTFVDAIWGDGPGGNINGHGLTRIKTGVSTGWELQSFTITPAVYYQSAMKETAPDTWLESEYWFKVTLSHSF